MNTAITSWSILPRSLVLALALAATACAGPLDTWHVRPSGTTAQLNDVAYGNGVFVAVGEDGTILNSPDGANWFPVNSGTVSRLDAIAFGNGVFVAVGGLGSKPMFTSPDGVNWTPRTTTIAGGYLDVIFNGQVFFCLAGKGAFGISTNGSDWTSGKIHSSQDPAAVAFGNGQWVVAGYKPSGSPHGMLWTSSDLTEWTPQDSMSPNNLFGAGFINGTFVVAGQNGVLASSPDGVAWTPQESQTSGFVWDFASDGEHLVAASQYGRLLYSANGVDWTRAETGLAWHLTGVTYGAGTFVAVGWDGAIVQSERTAPSAERPQLRIRTEAESVVLSWPRSATGYAVQYSPDPASGVWNQINVPVAETATEYLLTLDPSAAAAFFRLVK